MDISRLLLTFGFRTRVVHRLPGRIRIEIPALRKIPQEHRDVSVQLLEAVPLPCGVTRFRPSLITGNVLIEYDPAAINEDQVLGHLRSLVDLVAHHRDKILGLTAAHVPEVLVRLTALLRNGNGRPGISLKEVKIPDDVWT
jgi:hypothetical protein